MFDWLFEGLTTVYALLAALLICLLFAYWHLRRSAWLGAAVAILYAPQSGPETRDLLRQKAGEVKDKASDVVDTAKEKTTAAVDTAKIAPASHTLPCTG